MILQSRAGLLFLLIRSFIVRATGIGLAAALFRSSLSAEATNVGISALLQVTLAIFQVAGLIGIAGFGLWILSWLAIARLALRDFTSQRRDQSSSSLNISELIHFPFNIPYRGKGDQFLISQESIAKFEHWCGDVKIGISGVNLETKNIFNEEISKAGGQHPIENFQKSNICANVRFQEQIRDAKINKGGIQVYTISGHGGQHEFNVKVSDISPAERLLGKIYTDIYQIDIEMIHSMTIHNANISSVIVKRGAQNLSFCNCLIGRMSTTQKSLTTINLQNCYVGSLSISEYDSINDITIDGGTIRSISCPPPWGSNPIRGNVNISNVKWPTSSRESRLFKGTQSYRSLRAHLESLDNAPATMKMRVLELRSDRKENETGLIKFVGLLYDLCAQYGLSPGRPLIILFVIIALSAPVVCQTDSAALGLDRSQYTGWREQLLDSPRGICRNLFTQSSISDCIEDVFSAKCLPALVLSSQSSFNPFGFFSTRRLVIANSLPAYLLLVFQGLLSYTLLAMTAFGIRKRFKMH